MAKIGINIATGSLQQKEMIVGIDLGTTHSLVSIIHPDSRLPVALQEHNSGALVPSVIHIGKDGTVIVGEEAKKHLDTDPKNTIFSTKRLMGKSYNDVKHHAAYFSYDIVEDSSDSLVKVQAGERYYSPVELSAFILKELKHRAEHILKTSVTRAVITVPAYFNDAQRQATKDAGKLAGLEVLRILNEPTAASLAYGLGLKKDEEKLIAVYDLGGGTFDISILKISGGVFEVLSTSGNTYLGGDDFDRAIVKIWMKKHKLTEAQLIADKELSQWLRLKAETAKKRLGKEEVFIDNTGIFPLLISRNEFETAIQPLIDQTVQSCNKALNDAHLAVEDIEAVVMVGGSTRIPLVKEMISNFFNKPLYDSLNPEKVVAMGAAVKADILAGNKKELVLQDVTPLSIGLETMDGRMDVLIARNSKLPASASRHYSTFKDGQPGMQIAVYQGEHELVEDNRKLAAFNFSGIPDMPAGIPKVEVSFQINTDGILQVKAKELTSGVEQRIEVLPQFGLTAKTVDKMLSDSTARAREEIQKRALAEARADAELMLESTEKFLQKHDQALTQEEKDSARQAILALEADVTSADIDIIHNRMQALNEITRPFAERITNIKDSTEHPIQ
jgi:molecular chaperone HscA